MVSPAEDLIMEQRRESPVLVSWIIPNPLVRFGCSEEGNGKLLLYLCQENSLNND